MTAICILAQETNESAPMAVWAWVLVLGLVLVGAGIGLLLLQRHWRRMMRTPDGELMPFSLEQLRQLHRRGELTDDEFQRARQRIIDMTAVAGETATEDGAQAAEQNAPPPPDAGNGHDAEDDGSSPNGG
jgi:uncharacterized protein YjeT (DUF2065 family)